MWGSNPRPRLSRLSAFRPCQPPRSPANPHPGISLTIHVPSSVSTLEKWLRNRHHRRVMVSPIRCPPRTARLKQCPQARSVSCFPFLAGATTNIHCAIISPMMMPTAPTRQGSKGESSLSVSLAPSTDEQVQIPALLTASSPAAA